MNMLALFAILFWLTVLVLTGYHIFYWFIYEMRRRKKLRQSGERAVARIIDYKNDTDVDGGPVYFPILEFFTSEGEQVVVISDRSNLNNTQLSKEVTVYYETNNPQQFFIDNSVPFQVYLIPFGAIVAFIIVYQLIRIVRTF